MNGILRMKPVVVALLSVVLAGCESEPVKPPRHVATHIYNVRMTFEQEIKSNQSSPASGAVVGGILAGTAGAIIGASLASDGKTSAIPQGKLIACSFTAKIDNESRAFRFSGEGTMEAWKMRLCSTLRDNDMLRFWIRSDGSPEWELDR